MRNLVIAAAFVLVGCGGAPFTAGFAVDGGSPDALPAVEVTPEAAQQGEDSGSDARGDVVVVDSHVVEHDAGADAAPEAEAGPVVCVTDLSGVGAGDFRIAFTLTTSDVPVAYMALLNQRSRCDDTRPGWDVWMTAQGNLGVEVFDGSGGVYDYVTDNRPVNDGAAHRIVVGRSGASLTIGIDGASNTYPNDPIMSLATLSPMNVGIDPTCTGVSNISGRLTEACITKQ